MQPPLKFVSFIPHLSGHVIIYPSCEQNWSILVKGGYVSHTKQRNDYATLTWYSFTKFFLQTRTPNQYLVETNVYRRQDDGFVIRNMTAEEAKVIRIHLHIRPKSAIYGSLQRTSLNTKSFHKVKDVCATFKTVAIRIWHHHYASMPKYSILRHRPPRI